jgi:hypothetical protein
MPSFIADEPIVQPKVEVAPLYQLPNGDWIILADVRGVKAITASRSHMLHWPQVIIMMGNADDPIHYTLECLSDTQAREWRDRIAADRNAG